MENVSYTIDRDILYIGLHGRIDATNASSVEEEVQKIRNDHPSETLVLDAEHLEYISSAGLRVVLRLRKSNANLSMINASSAIYEILEMTGFTEMIDVQKAFPQISVEGCEAIGKGANGIVYRYDPETIVKYYYNKEALPEIRQERELARKAFVMGVNTAMPYGVVRIGDHYGTITELLTATSISKMIKKDPENIEEPVRLFVDMIKKVHSIELEPNEIPSMKEVAIDWVNFLKPHMADDQWNKLYKLVDEVPEALNMLHGDYHTSNVMVQNGEALLIDMDTLCMGHPIFELGSMFNAFIGFNELFPDRGEDTFLGFTNEVAEQVYHLSMKMYFEGKDEAFIADVHKKAMVIGYTRMLRRAIRRPEKEDSAVRIVRCKYMLEKLLPEVDTLLF